MIVQRFERGQKFLDLQRWVARGIDEDGCAIDDECWEVTVYENTDINPNEQKTIEFASELQARMFITMNGWKEQVL